jgi:hypothetical protein
MVPNPSKTKCMLITTRQKHQLIPPPLKLTFNSQHVEQVREQKVLGIIIDDKLCWQGHISKICKTLAKNLYLLSKLKTLTDETTRKLYFTAHIQPHLDYASTVWDGASDANFKRLNSLHRRAVKLIADQATCAISTDDKFKQFGVLPLHKQLTYNKLVLMRKVTLVKTPNYLNSLFHLTQRQSRTLRNDTIITPKPRLDIYKTSFSYSGAKLWNTLPHDLKSVRSIQLFKTRLHKHLQNS